MSGRIFEKVEMERGSWLAHNIEDIQSHVRIDSKRFTRKTFAPNERDISKTFDIIH